MENPQAVLIDLPNPLLVEISLIAEEEHLSPDEVILDLLQSGVSHAIEVRLQSKRQFPDSKNDD
jgi:hypothetical protein